MAENKIKDMSNLDDHQIDELRNHLRDYVSGLKDPDFSFFEALMAGHTSTTHSSQTQDERSADGSGGDTE